jgi:hypothetical protein
VIVWARRAAQAARRFRASAAAALAEYRSEGGVAAEAWLGSLAAETRAAYGADPDPA